ncbi:sigma-70 family RNA polymerase sigma factor [Streptomyces sp. DW26H14]|uniref:sigma-70 family RNA polymerase sigma factor n=1 Tax=Streptomyces sp. DW26H14 TaxID=3435395 RepID=UPI00403DD575
MTPALRAPTRPSDESMTAWALAARDGDKDAVEHLVRAVHRDIQRYIAYLADDPQKTDDLTQDTFLRALSSLSGFEGRSSVRTWILTIARRVVADSLRRAAARPRLVDRDDWQLLAEQTQDGPLTPVEDGVVLWELLGALSEGRRRAFVLTQVLGFRYEEAASLCACPVGTVRSRVARARQVLTAILQDTADAGTEGAEGTRGTGGTGEQLPVTP